MTNAQWPPNMAFLTSWMEADVKRILITVTILTMLPALADERKANELMQAALSRETVQGDLKGAIDLYGKAVKEAGANRALAAKALLRSGECYEKLGNAEARKVYDRVAHDYSDQAESAAAARGKLERLGSAAGPIYAGVAVRHIVKADGLNIDNVSPDGRFVSYNDEGVWVFELVGGQKKRLRAIAENAFWSNTAFSPDSSQLAYSWYGGGKAEIRAINLDGSGDRVLYTGQGRLELYEWVPGRLLIGLRKSPEQRELVTVSTADATAVKIKDLAGRIRGLYFSPDRQWLAGWRVSGAQDHEFFLLSATQGTEATLLRERGDDRLAGWMPDGKGIVLTRDVQGRGRKDVYLLRIENAKRAGPPVLIRQGIGLVTGVIGITKEGSFYHIQSAGEADILSAELDPATGRIVRGPAAATTYHLGTNGSPDWSPDGTKILYRSGMRPGAVLGREDRASVAILDVASGGVREIAPRLDSFAFPRWSPDGKTILVRGAAGEREGLFLLNPQNGETRKFVEARANYLQWLDGKSVVYMRPDTEGFFGGALVRHNLETGQTKELFRSGELGSRTLSISPDGTQVAFVANNILMTVPIDGGQARTVLQLPKPETFELFGGVAWTRDGRNLLFIKRPTGTTSRGVPSELWRVPAAGGTAEKMGLSMREMNFLSVHPDGKRIAFGIGFPSRQELWVVEGFAGFK